MNQKEQWETWADEIDDAKERGAVNDLSVIAYKIMNTRLNTGNVVSRCNSSKIALFDHVGFTPDWVEYAIDDQTDMFWCEDGENVIYGGSEDIVKYNETGDHYEDEIYTQRFYEKHVYRGRDFTMIFCNPRVDGCKWFRVFDNSLEIK